MSDKRVWSRAYIYDEITQSATSRQQAVIRTHKSLKDQGIRCSLNGFVNPELELEGEWRVFQDKSLGCMIVEQAPSSQP